MVERDGLLLSCKAQRPTHEVDERQGLVDAESRRLLTEHSLGHTVPALWDGVNILERPQLRGVVAGRGTAKRSVLSHATKRCS
jgi:hypothetical protein